MSALYPVHVDAHLDPALSRWKWMFKWLLAIPHYFVLAFLWAAFVVLSVVAFFAILFTGHYPPGIFDFNVGVLRWTWRVAYYAFGANGTDRYPPFSLEDQADYPTHLAIDYPEHLSRGLVLVKTWLLAIPHYLVLSVFLGGAGWAIGDAVRIDSDASRGTGLIGLLVCVAVVVLLFTGRYPRPIFDFVLGLNRWVLRVAAYASLMTDVYPPFRLDQGGDDPVLLRAPDASTPPPPPAAPATVTAPVDTASPTAPTSPTGPVRPWTAGRVLAVVCGSALVLGSVGIGAAGGVAAYADHGLRDSHGYVMSGKTRLSTETYAIASTSVTVHADAPAALMPDKLLGDVKVTAAGAHRPVFVGIATTADVQKYLGGVRHETLTDLAKKPVYRNSGGGAPTVAPTATDIWVAQSAGTGTREVVWPVLNGDWTLVVMNADGSSGVTADVAAGATLPALDWLVPTLLVTAGVGMVLGTVLLLLGVRRRA